MPNKVEKFTNRSRSVLQSSQDAAEKFQHGFISTEHLLLGLLIEEGGLASHVLRDLDLELQLVNEWVKQHTKMPPIHPNVEPNLTQDIKDILFLAVDEARRMGNTFVGTEHLLLGLVRQSNSAAVEMLRHASITPEQVRRRTRLILQEASILSGDINADTLSASRRMTSKGIEITEEELLHLNISDFVEVVDGVVITPDIDRIAHGIALGNLYDRLCTFTKEYEFGFVSVENLICILLKEDHKVIRSLIPELSFIRKERLPDYIFPGAFPGAPNLAIEAVTRFKSRYSAWSKMRDYFAHGTEETWIIYPKYQQICVYKQNNPSEAQAYKIGDTLSSALFPDLTIAISDLFSSQQ